MAVPNTFALATSAIPLANLDANFAYYDTAYSITGTTVSFNGSVSITTSNLTFNGTAQRITGDFSNATVASRVMFQTSTVNSNTLLGVIPNGTALTSFLSLYNNSDPTNSSILELSNQRLSGEARIASSIAGTGTYLPMTFYTGGSERVRIDTSGNVGIGTSSLSGKFHVSGGRSYFTANAEQFALALKYNAATTGVWLGSPTTDSFTVATEAGTERMRINSTGNVGIGLTSYSLPLSVVADANGQNIQINGRTGDDFGQIFFRNFGGANNIARIASDNSAGLIFGTGSQTAPTVPSERMRIDSSGNVGIGTSLPATELQLYKNKSGDSTKLNITNPNDTGGVLIQMNAQTTSPYQGVFGVANAGGYMQIGMVSSHPIQFITNNTERMRIDTVGNMQMQAGAVMPYAPAPASISTTATLTNANIQAQIINTTGTTYTVTMPLGTTLETLATWATTNVAYDFFVINTATGIITMAVNTGVTSLGLLTIAAATSAHFRIRRTAANTFVLYRLV